MKRALLGAWFIGTMLCSAVRAQAGTITVTSGGDAGGPCPGVACTLRQAILDAVPGDTIDFAPGLTTIDLTTAELVINKNLTISGPGADLLAVQRSTAQGTPNFRIFNIASGNVITISGLTISNGNASDPGGGGILNSNGSTVNVTSSTLSANFATASQGGGGGGGIYNSSGGTVNITNSTLADNGGGSSAGAGGGGGIYNLGTVTVTASTLSDNHGSAISGGSGGGGVLNQGMATITNSTLSGNSGGRFGGGIYNPVGTSTVTGCTIAANTTGLSGGGIFNDFGTTVNVRNSIIATNGASPGGGTDFGGTLTSQGYNLIGSTSGTTITGDTTGNQLNVDPMLGPLQDNGGTTFTHALLFGSTAIDKGQSSGSNTDQRGLIRPVDDPAIPNAAGGDGSDIGAYEEQTLTPIPPPTPTPTATATPPPTPTPTATLPPSPSPTLTPAPSATPTPVPAAQALNLSTRMHVSSGDWAGIGGFIITGTAPKHVLIRAIGPSITGISGILADPMLELHGPGAFVTINNDNWRDDPVQEAAIIASGLAPANNLEAAIDVTLSPGAYTAVVRGKNNFHGIGLVEVYDLSQAVPAKLGNISTRSFVGVGGITVVIAGFILGGQSGSDNIVVRGLGPSLESVGLSTALPNPTLELRDHNGALLAANNDWQSNSGQAAELIAAGLAPANPLEAALAVTLPPGAYTALLADRTNLFGYALIEVYDRGAGPPVPFPSPTPPDPGPSLPPPPMTPTPSPITPTPTPTPPPGVTPSPTPSATATVTPLPATPTPGASKTCSENFDGGAGLPPGWTGSWVISTINPFSAPNCLFVPDSSSVSDAVFDSPNISIHSVAAVLTLENNFNTEHTPPPGEVFWDGWVMEVSVNGGAFNDVTDPSVGGTFVSGGYTGEIDGTSSNPLAGRQAWSGNSGGYIHTVINFPASLNGQFIKVRFRMGTGGAGSAPGVRIDDFVLTGGSCL